MKDELGERIKSYYEDRYRLYLSRRTYSIIRIDGKSFHTYTKGAEKPFDIALMEAMDHAAIGLCENIQGAKFAYVQSDEISILLTDFEKVNTSAWFDGNIQKIASVSASIATAFFNKKRMEQGIQKTAMFDSRVFVVPDRTEIENYFIWRQSDCVRNSISMTTQQYYSHSELMGKSTDEMQEMLFLKGVNWNDFSERFKRGRIIEKEYYKKDEAKRSKWVSKGCYFFTKEREVFQRLIPEHPGYQKTE